MRDLSRTTVPLFTFLLGALVATAVTGSSGVPEAAAGEGAAAASVISSEQAVVRVAASGKASITVLARGDNAFLGRLEMAGGGKVPLHRDSTEEYIHVLSGSGTLSIDGAAHSLAAGTTVFMPANAEVSYENGPEPLLAIQVFAGPEPAQKYDGWTVRPPE